MMQTGTLTKAQSFNVSQSNEPVLTSPDLL
jgi:hypothetical protein